MSTSGEKFTAKDWDEVRMGFHTSIMVDISLNSLAQNLDAPDWPLPGKEETPAKYIDQTFEDLQLMPGLAGNPGRVDQLISILRETLAFDNPFGEMVEQTAVTVEKDNPLLKNLAKLGIPFDFPIELTTMSADAKEFCRLEKMATLEDFAAFAQNMPPQIIVGGDFRSLLNALAHVNEEALAKILPFRPGSKGLHLLEALGQLVGALPVGERLAHFEGFGGQLNSEEETQRTHFDKEGLQQAEDALRERAIPLIELFKAEFDELVISLKAGGSLERALVVLRDPVKEALVRELLVPPLSEAGVTIAPTAGARKGGLRGIFSRFFKK